MKKEFILFLLVLLSTFVYAQKSLQIMSYNVHNGVGMDNISDYQRIANVIIKANPDVVAIQEVDSVTNRSGKRYVLGEIAEYAQLHATFAPAIDFDGGKYGIGILSKQKPIGVQMLPLPGAEEKRMLLAAEFEGYIFCCTHLSLTETDRMTSLELIKTFAAESKKPLIIAGDMNAHPESAFIEGLKKDFRVLSDMKSATYPAPAPTVVIDYIALLKSTAKGIECVSAQVLDEAVASDHRPIVVRVHMAEKADFSALF